MLTDAKSVPIRRNVLFMELMFHNLGEAGKTHILPASPCLSSASAGDESNNRLANTGRLPRHSGRSIRRTNAGPPQGRGKLSHTHDRPGFRAASELLT